MSSVKVTVYMNILGLGIISTALYLLLRALGRRSNRRKLAAPHNCKPPRAYPHLEPILGLDAVYESRRTVKPRSFLQRQRSQYEAYGKMFSSKLFTTHIINTIEPENIRTVLSTKFSDYGIGQRRKDAFAPLLGRRYSIFQVDGDEWKHSKALFKPAFSNSLISNLETFEQFVKTLIDAIPDGKLVDLGPLFYRFATQVMTNSMFDRSVESNIGNAKMNTALVDVIHSV